MTIGIRKPLIPQPGQVTKASDLILEKIENLILQQNAMIEKVNACNTALEVLLKMFDDGMKQHGIDTDPQPEGEYPLMY